MLFYQAEIIAKQMQAEVEMKAKEAWKFTSMKETKQSYLKDAWKKVFGMSVKKKEMQRSPKCYNCCQA